MVRILHFADLHLGVESHGRLDPNTGLSTRLGDFLRALDAVVEYALSEDIHLVIFAGDAYKGREPSPTHQREFAKRIRRLAEADIPVLLLAGNHDVPYAVGRAHSIEIFDTLGVEKVHVAGRPGTHLIHTKGGPVQVVAIPWVTRSRVLSKEEYKDKPINEVDEIIISKLEGIIGEETERLDPRLPTVLVAHATLLGATYGSERSVMLGQEMVLPRGLVQNPAFDYVALGHIHKHQAIADSPPAVYAGSLERVDFGEEKEDKGFVVVEIDKGQETTWKFVPLPARRFVTIEVEARGQDPMAKVKEAISDHDINDAVVRVLIRTDPETAPLIQEREIESHLQGAFHVAAISKEVERTVRIRLSGGAVEEMAPEEVLRRYLKAKKVPSQRSEVLLEHAKRIFEEVSYDATT